MTLTSTLDRIEVTLVRIYGGGLPTHKIRSKSGKLYVDVRTDTAEFQSTRSSAVGDDLKTSRQNHCAHDRRSVTHCISRRVTSGHNTPI